jgi:nucleoside-diphosphate-sugar epimerase
MFCSSRLDSDVGDPKICTRKFCTWNTVRKISARPPLVNPLFIEVDEIYHLASPASPPHYMYNPVKTIKTNTVGTVNMLGLAKRTKAKILIASTSEVSRERRSKLKIMELNFTPKPERHKWFPKTREKWRTSLLF